MTNTMQTTRLALAVVLAATALVAAMPAQTMPNVPREISADVKGSLGGEKVDLHCGVADVVFRKDNFPVYLGYIDDKLSAKHQRQVVIEAERQESSVVYVVDLDKDECVDKRPSLADLPLILMPWGDVLAAFAMICQPASEDGAVNLRTAGTYSFVCVSPDKTQKVTVTYDTASNMPLRLRTESSDQTVQELVFSNHDLHVDRSMFSKYGHSGVCRVPPKDLLIPTLTATYATDDPDDGKVKVQAIHHFATDGHSDYTESYVRTEHDDSSIEVANGPAGVAWLYNPDQDTCITSELVTDSDEHYAFLSDSWRPAGTDEWHDQVTGAAASCEKWSTGYADENITACVADRQVKWYINALDDEKKWAQQSFSPDAPPMSAFAKPSAKCGDKPDPQA